MSGKGPGLEEPPAGCIVTYCDGCTIAASLTVFLSALLCSTDGSVTTWQTNLGPFRDPA